MQRKRKAAPRYYNKLRTRLTTTSEKQALPKICAVRFYWAANKRRGQQQMPITLLDQSQIAIRCCPRRATPTVAIAELTLGMLITSWVRWLYIEHDIPGRDAQPPR